MKRGRICLRNDRGQCGWNTESGKESVETIAGKAIKSGVF